MSTWNDMKTGFRKITNTVICKTDEFAEEAALAVKQRTVEAHLSEAYEKLGRVAYRLLAKEDVSIRTNEDLLVASREVDQLRKELNEVKAAIRRFKQKQKSDGTKQKQATASEDSED